MSPSVQQILQNALALPDEDQLQLVAALNAAVDERGLRPFNDEWLAEINRRSDEFDAGLAAPVDWETVKQQARREILGSE